MKYIQAKFILCAMLAVSPMFVSAQATDWNETDSLANEKDPMVQVAFRKVAQKDLLGGVSVVNVEELTKKNYNTYSLDNMQGYVGGWNGTRCRSVHLSGSLWPSYPGGYHQVP